MYYLIVFGALVALELLYFSIAKHFHVVDRPNERSSHHRVVLLGAGIIFFFATMVYAFLPMAWGVASPIFNVVSGEVPFWAMAVGVTALAVVSYVDDLRGIPSWLRLIVQMGAVLFTFWVAVSSLQIWQVVLLVVVFVGILNVYNFMDGINGMLAAYSFVVVGTFGYLDLFVSDGQFVDIRFIATILIAIVVFGFFNFRPKARCFSGDVGSIVMGFIVLFLMVRYIKQAPITGEAVSCLCFIIVYLADGLLTVAKRFLTGRNILEAHREHLYETLVNDLHVPHLRVSAAYAGLQLLINVGFMLVPDHNLYTLLVALALVGSYGLFFYYCNVRHGIRH